MSDAAGVQVIVQAIKHVLTFNTTNCTTRQQNDTHRVQSQKLYNTGSLAQHGTYHWLLTLQLVLEQVRLPAVKAQYLYPYAGQMPDNQSPQS